MSDQKPSVGRVVHYYDNEVENQNKPGPYVGFISAVHSDTCCTLSFVMPWDTTVGVASSCMRKDAAGEKAARYWEWPPRV